MSMEPETDLYAFDGPQPGMKPSAASAGYRRSSYILESETWDGMKKLVPDNHGGWTLFKCRGGSWEWEDSICDDSCISLLEQAEKVYMRR